MSELSHDTDDGYEWSRAYLALSRSGVVTPDIEACEAAWAEEFWGFAPAAERIRMAPGYLEYVSALRGILHFPLQLYWVACAEYFRCWRESGLGGPIAATFALGSARLLMDVHPENGPTVLVGIQLADPEAVIMRGRLAHYALVLDLRRIDQDCIEVLSHS
jgi:hypothetical protein